MGKNDSLESCSLCGASDRRVYTFTDLNPDLRFCFDCMAYIADAHSHLENEKNTFQTSIK